MVANNNFNGYYAPAQQQPQSARMPVFTGLKGRPVSSLEEARAASIDFDGSISFFPDIANKRIYTKQINPDGTASLNMYELQELPTLDTSGFVTKSEFDLTLGEIRNALQELTASRQMEEQNPEFKF